MHLTYHMVACLSSSKQNSYSSAFTNNEPVAIAENIVEVVSALKKHCSKVGFGY